MGTIGSQLITPRNLPTHCMQHTKQNKTEEEEEEEELSI
jgi:hypothetical protein